MTLSPHQPYKSALPNSNQLLELDQMISGRLSSVLAYLHARFKYTTKTNQMRSGGWSQFLQEADEPPSVTGTACILTAMIQAGDPKPSELIILGKQYIVINMRDDGGWSKPSLNHLYSTTLITCLATRALIETGQALSSGPIEKGVNWLLIAQNRDGGWGNLARDNQSNVTCTSYALRLLTRVLGVYPGVESAVTQSQEWLITMRNPDGSWGMQKNESGTSAHTSHAVEALLDCGADKSILFSSRKWLLANIHNNAQFSEHYLVPLERGKRVTERLTWTHLSEERALIALLKLNVSVSTPEVQAIILRILARQVNGTYWRIDNVPGSAPSWAILEAVSSLRLYLDNLRQEGLMAEMSSTIAQLTTEINEQRVQITNLEERLSRLSWHYQIRRVTSFILRPIPLITLVTILLLLIYFVLRERYQMPASADTFVVLLGIISFVLSAYQIIELLKDRKD